MGVVTDYFSKSYCINLSHRQDKWEECVDQFAKHGLVVERFEGVNGDDVQYDGAMKKGVVGCFMSHRNILEKAQREGLESTLIFEDDVEFDPELNKKFNDWYKEVPEDWDMLYFGGNHNVGYITKCNDHLMRATNTQTTHAYAIREKAYITILKRLQTLDLDVDVVYTQLQKTLKAYCFTPRLAWQRPGISDIWKQRVDYKFLKDLDGCHLGMRK